MQRNYNYVGNKNNYNSEDFGYRQDVNQNMGNNRHFGQGDYGHNNYRQSGYQNNNQGVADGRGPRDSRPAFGQNYVDNTGNSPMARASAANVRGGQF